MCLTINTAHKKRGPGYWKLNTSILNDEKYIKNIENIIDKTLNDYCEVGKKVVWELCKIRTRLQESRATFQE